MVTSLIEILKDKPCIGTDKLLNETFENNFHILSCIVEKRYSKKYAKELTTVRLGVREEYPVIDENGVPQKDDLGNPLLTSTIISSAKAIVSMFECCGRVNTALKNGAVIGPCKIIERANNNNDRTYQLIVPANEDTDDASESNNNG